MSSSDKFEPSGKPCAVDEVPMTEDQKFTFDLKGWLLVPSVLNEAQIQACRQHLTALVEAPETLPPDQRHHYAGPVADLWDHPVIVGILRTIICKDMNEKAYGFRADGSYIQRRKKGNDGIEPHGGGPNVHPNFNYQCRNGEIYSGLTRVVWELNPVEKGAGGTLLMSGSHKSGFHVPKSHLVKSSPLYETYSCPPGSVLLFTENLCHSGALWNSDTPRLAVFNCYSHHQCQFHKGNWNHDTIMTFPEKRRTLFRGVWGHDFHAKGSSPNDYYGKDNHSW